MDAQGKCAGSEGYLPQMFGVLSGKREMEGGGGGEGGGSKSHFLLKVSDARGRTNRTKRKKEKKCSLVLCEWLLAN